MQSHSLATEAYYPEALDYISAYTKANAVNDYLNLIKETKALCSIPVIASINCYKADTWIDFARQIELAGADALELNIYFLETGPEEGLELSRKVYADVVRRVKAAISIPVILKISKYYCNIPNLVNILKVNGADGVVLFNRFYQPDIDLNNLQVVSGNVFSSHSDCRVSVLPLRQAYMIGKMSLNACWQALQAFRCVARSIRMVRRLSRRY